MTEERKNISVSSSFLESDKGELHVGEGGVPVSNRRSKRLFDLALSAVALAFLAPTFAVVAIFIKYDSAGPIFIRRQRTGVNGRLFNIYNFRTTLTHSDIRSGKSGKTVEFPTTYVGHTLRRIGLVELPQLVNILIGDMSFVGPRAHTLADDKEFTRQVAGYPARFACRPGLVGLAQLAAGSKPIRTKSDVEDQLAYDLKYISTWSLLLDIRTIIRALSKSFF